MAHMSESSLPPQDIIFYGILTRLPTKSLSRFKYVNKPWFAWITSHEFAQLHLLNQTSSALIEDDHNLVFESHSRKDVFFSLPNHLDDIAVELDYPFKDPQSSSKICGSCNGLLLVDIDPSHGHRKLCIWNPCTKNYITLPSPVQYSSNYSNIGSTLMYNRLAAGFGCDPTTNDYMVVMIWLCKYIGFDDIDYDYDHDQEKREVIIYTTRSNTWRTIIPQIPLDGIDFFGKGYFMNGAIYWLGAHIEHIANGLRFLIYFDIESEGWGKIPFKTNIEGDIKFEIRQELRVTPRGNLCVFHTYCRRRYGYKVSNFCTDIYVLMNKGNQGSWSKMCSLTSSRVASVEDVCFIADNTVLVRSVIKGNVVDDDHLALYNLTNGRMIPNASLEVLKTHPYRDFIWREAVGYYRSLISPGQLVG